MKLATMQKSHIIVEYNPQTFGIPEKLINVIITDNLIVVLFLHELAINDLAALISHEPVERLDDVGEIQAFRN